MQSDKEKDINPSSVLPYHPPITPLSSRIICKILSTCSGFSQVVVSKGVYSSEGKAIGQEPPQLLQATQDFR